MGMYIYQGKSDKYSLGIHAACNWRQYMQALSLYASERLASQSKEGSLSAQHIGVLAGNI